MTRMVATAWWGFCFIGVATYGVNIGVNLVLNRMVQKIEMFEHMDKHRRVDWGTTEESMPWHWFR